MWWSNMSLIHRWPLTENPNDVVGSLNMTNNGGVTFSSDGTLIDSTNKNLAFTRSAFIPATISIWVKGTLPYNIFGAIFQYSSMILSCLSSTLSKSF